MFFYTKPAAPLLSDLFGLALDQVLGHSPDIVWMCLRRSNLRMICDHHELLTKNKLHFVGYTIIAIHSSKTPTMTMHVCACVDVKIAN